MVNKFCIYLSRVCVYSTFNNKNMAPFFYTPDMSPEHRNITVWICHLTV